MKKLLGVMIFCLLLAKCFAESWIEYQNIQLDADKVAEANADLSQIEIDFCDKPWEKEIVYTLTPGWIQDVCLEATNTSSKAVEVTIEFVDGTVTNDQWKNKACMQQWENKNFWQYVTGFTASFTIPANNVLFHHAKIQLPKWSSGYVNGCLVYYTKGVEMGGQMNFTVLMRKAKFIDIIIKSQAQSLKFKAAWLLLGGILLLIFFTKFHKKK